MKTIVSRISSRGLAICRVTGVYLDDEVFRSITTAIRNTAPTEDDFQSWGSLLISSLHRMFTENGNKPELLAKYGRSAHGWYQASCELVLLNFQDTTIELGQLGSIHVYSRRNDQRCFAVAPVHNVAQELRHATIEDSSLQPFETRPQRKIAEQLLYASPEVVPLLASMKRDDFINAIAHCPTRAIGFFPNMESGTLSYSKHSPVPEYREFTLSGQVSVVLFFPSAGDLMHYDEERLRLACENQFCGNAEQVELDDCFMVDSVSCIEINQSQMKKSSTTLTLFR